MGRKNKFLSFIISPQPSIPRTPCYLVGRKFLKIPKIFHITPCTSIINRSNGTLYTFLILIINRGIYSVKNFLFKIEAG